MMSLKKQVFGYNKSQVDELINEKDNEIKQLNDQIKKLQEDYTIRTSKIIIAASCKHPRTNK